MQNNICFLKFPNFELMTRSQKQITYTVQNKINTCNFEKIICNVQQTFLRNRKIQQYKRFTKRNFATIQKQITYLLQEMKLTNSHHRKYKNTNKIFISRNTNSFRYL